MMVGTNFPMRITADIVQKLSLGHESGSPSGQEHFCNGMQKVARYNAEEKKERIQRYRTKRNQRNFNKKITVYMKVFVGSLTYAHLPCPNRNPSGEIDRMVCDFESAGFLCFSWLGAVRLPENVGGQPAAGEGPICKERGPWGELRPGAVESDRR